MGVFIGSEWYEEKKAELVAMGVANPSPKPLNMSKYEVEGRLARLWNVTQRLGIVFLDRDRLVSLSELVRDQFRYDSRFRMISNQWIDSLLKNDVIRLYQKDPELFEIVGNAKRIAAIEKKREAGKKGNEVRWECRKSDPNAIADAIRVRPFCDSNDNDNDNDNNYILPDSSLNQVKKAVIPQGKVEKRGKIASATAKAPKDGSVVWEVYSRAFNERYGTDPARSAKVNSIMKNLVASFGKDGACDLVRFYLASNDPFIVQNTHTVQQLAFRSEQLYNQMRLKEALWTKEDDEFLNEQITSGVLAEGDRESFKQRAILSRKANQ